MGSLGIAFVLLVIGTGLLLVGSDWFVDGAGDLARSLGMSTLVLGVLLAGLEPEEMLAAAIAVGNIIGTNVTIVTAALGLSAWLFPMAISARVRRQALIATGYAGYSRFPPRIAAKQRYSLRSKIACRG